MRSTAARAALPALASVRDEVDRYYTERFRQFGPTPLGVGWTCTPTQELRFVQFERLLGFSHAFSVNDIGCGYGALLGFLRRRNRKVQVDYVGTDISQVMVDAARRHWKRLDGARFQLSGEALRTADYCVASGIFNVKLAHDRSTWEGYVEETLRDMYAHCNLGIAVNFLMADAGLDDIPEHYRCVPERWAAYGRTLGASVELRDNYGMPEFTLALRRH